MGIFARHVKLVLVEGIFRFRHWEVSISKHPKDRRLWWMTVADGTILEVASHQAGAPPLQFRFLGIDIGDVAEYGPASFEATLSNPTPPGEITTSGKFGPWNADDVGKTAVSGDYRFEHAGPRRLPRN